MSLKLEGVGKRVGGELHLDGIDLELAPGSLTVLLGPTLAGKTSLMRLMAGLDRPTQGRILNDGADVTGVSVRKRSVAMVYQQFINYPAFTVYENIASPLRRAGLPAGEIDAKVRAAAQSLRIDALLDRLPAELSGGQQQRTALARALVREADLLLLDEPLVNLDYKLREELRSELKAVFGRGRSKVVYATTEPLEALMLGGRSVVMSEGRIVQQGPTLEVYHNPSRVEVGQVFSDPPLNLIAGQVRDGAARLGESLTLPLDGHLGGLPPGGYRFGVRANHLGVKRAGAEDLEFRAVVELSEISGSETFIHARHSGVSWVVQEEGVHSLALGQSLSVFVNPRQIFVFDSDGKLVAAPPRGSVGPAPQ